jgi:hypothetical protein
MVSLDTLILVRYDTRSIICKKLVYLLVIPNISKLYKYILYYFTFNKKLNMDIELDLEAKTYSQSIHKNPSLRLFREYSTQDFISGATSK